MNQLQYIQKWKINLTLHTHTFPKIVKNKLELLDNNKLPKMLWDEFHEQTNKYTNYMNVH
jgi:hypothetical protein